jgi:predicted nucleic acid-binding protein
MRAFLDTNVLVRHLTGDPPEQARRATAFLRAGHELLLQDVVLAEAVYVLGSIYRRPRPEVAAALRTVITMPSVVPPSPEVALDALAMYESTPMNFVDAYLAATAGATGVRTIASFDRDLDRAPGVRRVEP